MKILIPVDGSPCSQAAVAFVAARRVFDGQPPEIDVLNVQTPLPPRGGRAVDAEYAQRWYEAESRRVLDPAVALLQQAALHPAAFRRVGHPGSEVTDWVQTKGIDLIVIGSHGRGTMRNLLLGSMAQTLVASTAVPLLLLRSPDVPDGKAMRVGIALDGGAASLAAIDFVLEHRAFFGPNASFALLHSLDVGSGTASLAAGARAQIVDLWHDAVRSTAREQVIEPVLARFAEAGLDANVHWLNGRPGTQIARFANEAPLDLLVMGSRGRGALANALLGSVAMRVAAACATPLLLVHQPTDATRPQASSRKPKASVGPSEGKVAGVGRYT